MHALNIIGGVALLLLGIWLAIAQIKNMISGKPDTLGGGIRLLIVGVGCVVCGIILILKYSL